MKPKNFKNDNGVGAVGVLLGLTFYIFMLSFVIAFVITQMYGISVIKGIDLPKAGETFESEQNYQNGSYDININHAAFWSEWDYIKGVGLSLKSVNFMQPKGYAVIKYIQPDTNGDYTNTYYINNSVHADYCIGMRVSASGENTEICIDDRGFYIPDYWSTLMIYAGDRAFYSYPNANLIEDLTIKTVYNENVLHADVYFNNILIISTSDLEAITDLLVMNKPVYYAGLGSSDVGITLKDFKTENSIIMPSDTNILSSLADLLSVMFAISIWSIPAWILPTEFVIIFITLPEAGLIITVLIVLIRGVD